MKRRDVLKSTLAGAAVLAAPRIARADAQKVLRFIPQADLASLDPVWTTADVTRNHAFLVFDTLYGLDNTYQAHPQMAAGHSISADKLQWDITLRDGLKFHDNTPVLAKDCVASIQRWEKRAAFGAALASATNEISAPSDKVIRFKLKKPFPLAADGAGGDHQHVLRHARAPGQDRPVPAGDGDGGQRAVPLLAKERVPGAKIVYEKFTGYVPRTGGPAESTAGPKTVFFDRVEWTMQPDAATALAALISGEFDWWENPTIDLVPQLKADKKLVVTVKDHTGEIGCMAFNETLPPFNNPAICRVVLSAINQGDYMQSVAGAVPELIKTGVGLFAPGTPMASTVGIDMMKGMKHLDALKRDLIEAGYKGEKVVVLAAANLPAINAIAEVGGDMLKKLGFNVDYQALDWGTVVQRRTSKAPLDKGGWNIFFTYFGGGTQNVNPASDGALRADGNGWFGWPTDPVLEKLRLSWFDAPDLAAQQAVCAAMQAEFFKRPSYAPLGMYFQPTAFYNYLQDVPEGIPQFYRVKRV